MSDLRMHPAPFQYSAEQWARYCLENGTSGSYPSNRVDNPKMHPDNLYGPVEEWTRYCIDNGIRLPIPSFPENAILPDERIQQDINKAWEKSSRQTLEADGLEYRVDISQCAIQREGDPDDKFTIRAYRPKNTKYHGVPLPLYVHFHGGGFLAGNLDTEDATCVRMVAQLEEADCPVIVISVGYRVTSEAPHPAAYQDAWDAYEYLERNTDIMFGGDVTHVIVGGVDAGAALALHLAVFSNLVFDEGMQRGLTIIGLMLCSPRLPYMDAEGMGISGEQGIDAPIWPQALHLMFCRKLAIYDVQSPEYVLNSLTKYEGLPKTGVLITGQSLLRDQGLKLRDRLEACGVPVQCRIYPGLPHDFRRINELPTCVKWDEDIVEGIRWFLGLGPGWDSPARGRDPYPGA
ncbi:alpha/beta-hydrolase [Aspergillus sclerotioniger CBS 115572]|uniref:Alpha/beta-hydrolase n=1 Tax=Aspergillus sclerotioniger CBS 115572 TaxID=1450535 RepID=A0A317WHB0_9EURO|nr:alpha/beta-hydrolase [Aspergillus sclerotioniger CBS 115572]PWY85864.1 alpha/beta-hydrolase [Aspergillus sclerotioniger CBS 115572]